MKATHLWALGIGLALAAPVVAGSRWDYTDQTLDNGLRVIVMEDHSAPIVAVQIWYHVGSKDEKPDRTGFAHMFEHMMFRGTELHGARRSTPNTWSKAPAARSNAGTVL